MSRTYDVVNDFWFKALGLDCSKLSSGLVHFSSQGIYLDRDPSGLFILEFIDKIVVAASSNVLDELRIHSSKEYESFELWCEQNSSLLKSFQLEFDDIDSFIDANGLKKHSLSSLYEIKKISPAQSEDISTLLEACAPYERETVEINLEDEVWGVFTQGRMVSCGRYMVIPQTQGIADLAVITHPDFRSKGLAKALLSKVCEEAIKLDLNPRYRARSTNFATRNVAQALGYIEVSRIRKFVPLVVNKK